MNKKEIVVQNNNIKQSIQRNIDTIKDLIEESDNIKKIIDHLKKQEFNRNNAYELEKVLENINSSIKKLLDQTNFLFDSYKRFLDFTFKK